MTLQIIGIPQSNFVRAVRMVAEEKGIEYELLATMPHSEEINAISPTGKVPGLRHGDLQLSESQPIARYIDNHFDGPKLVPEDRREAGKVEQWISIAATDIDQLLIRNYVVEYIFHKDEDGNVDILDPASSVWQTVSSLPFCILLAYGQREKKQLRVTAPSKITFHE